MILQNVFAFLGRKNEAILALEIEIKERLLETRKRSDGFYRLYWQAFQCSFLIQRILFC